MAGLMQSHVPAKVWEKKTVDQRANMNFEMFNRIDSLLRVHIMAVVDSSSLFGAGQRYTLYLQRQIIFPFGINKVILFYTVMCFGNITG